MTYEPKHRGEPEFEIFEPGDVVNFKGLDRPRAYDFVVLVGGYCTTKDWVFASLRDPMTSKDFVKVGSLGKHGF